MGLLEGAIVSNNEAVITRIDHYTIKINGVLITANEDQEQRIRDMTPEQIQNFMHIFYGDSE
jgi:hypothetical protein